MRKIRRHTWLFSFTDVAFLLLLVYTQLARMSSNEAPVAEMRLPAPVVVRNPELSPMKAVRDYQQVLVGKHSERPFILVHIVAGNEVSRGAAMSYDQLGAALQALLSANKGTPRPVVVPLPESYSSDLLQSTALVGRLWSEAGGAVVHTQKSEGRQ